MRKISNRKGFSLIEVMVVVGIVSIIVAVAIPNLWGILPMYRVNYASRELMADFIFAKTSAIKDGVCYMLTMHTDTNTYEVRTASTVVKWVTLPQGIVFNAPSAALVQFPNPYGFVPYGANCTFCGGTPTGTAYFSPNGQSVSSVSAGSPPADGSISLAPLEDISTSRTDRVRRIAVVGNTGTVRRF